VVDGKIVEGNYGAGAEGGHTVISAFGRKCTCGRLGCFETYASATALIADTKAEMRENKGSLMWEFVNYEIDKVDGATAFECSKKDDLSAEKVVDNYIKYLGEGIANFINIFRPDIVLIGGGVCAQGNYLIKPLQKYVDKNIYGGNLVPPVPIKTAVLGSDAGIIGAAALCIK